MRAAFVSFGDPDRLEAGRTLSKEKGPANKTKVAVRLSDSRL